MIVMQTTNGAKYAVPTFQDNLRPEAGPLPLIPGGTPADKLPVLKLSACVRQFDTSNENDLADYMQLLTDISNQKAQCITIERKWDEKDNKFFVYCEWVTGNFTMETTNDK